MGATENETLSGRVATTGGVMELVANV